MRCSHCALAGKREEGWAGYDETQRGTHVAPAPPVAGATASSTFCIDSARREGLSTACAAAEEGAAEGGAAGPAVVVDATGRISCSGATFACGV